MNQLKSQPTNQRKSALALANEALATWSEVFKLLARANRQRVAIGAILTFVEVLLSIFVLYQVKALIDVLTTQLTASEVLHLTSITLNLAIAFGALLASIAVKSVSEYVQISVGIDVSEQVTREIHQKAVNADLAFFESPRYFDSLQRARQAGTQRPSQVIARFLSLFRAGMFLAISVVVLATIDWRILPILVLIISIVLIFRLRFTKELFNWVNSLAQKERKAGYFDFLLTSNQFAKEIKAGGLGQYFQIAYRQVKTEINDGQLSIQKRRAIIDFGVSFVGTLIFAAATMIIVFDVSQGRQSVGNLVMFVLLFRRGEAAGRDAVRSLATMYDDQLYLRQLFDFLSIERRISGPNFPASINVSKSHFLKVDIAKFRYPEEEKNALTDVSLELGPNKIIALVGANGSGKTSLIKLILRLYDPNDGSITLDGVNIKRFEPEQYRRLFGVVFQDYARYADTLANNVYFGNVESSQSQNSLDKALTKGGAWSFISSLPKGTDTLLTRMFDGGTELSTGEWQRIALSRAFYSNAPFLILDEPSSALDPEAEDRLFQSFRSNLEGRSAIVISHRLSTVRLADFTYVLDGGRIVECGTHKNLINSSTRYAELFEAQAKYYKN